MLGSTIRGGVSKPQFQSLWRDFSENLVVSSTGEWYNLDKIMERHLHRARVHRGAKGAHKVHIFTNFFVCEARDLKFGVNA